MIWNGKPKFDYKSIKRVDSATGRVYDINAVFSDEHVEL